MELYQLENLPAEQTDGKPAVFRIVAVDDVG
jgi:hypothetical protein